MATPRRVNEQRNCLRRKGGARTCAPQRCAPMRDPLVARRGPLVSVLTPSYNQARWLPDNLRSVARQSYSSIEHVIMDGGSTDGSRGILADASPAIVWESGPDLGQSDAINKAFHRSKGDIVGWLNSDDAYFSSDVVARAVEVFDRRPEIGVVYGHAALVNGDGTLLHVLWTPAFAPAILRAYNLICQPTVFVRRAAVGRPDLVDPAFDYSMDWELLLYLARRTRFFRLNRIISIDRHHLQRKSLTRLDLAASDQKLIAQRYRIPAAASNRVLRKTTTLAIRVAGLSKLMEATGGSDVVPLNVAPAREIAIRQIAQFRRWMPSGDSPRTPGTRL
jgi:glycosyltransferase involved in cell wall biosynthesis